MQAIEKIDQLLEEQKLDAFLAIDKPVKNPDLYYILGIKIPDPVTFLRVPEKTVLLTSEMEKNRCRKEADVDEVRTTSEFRKKGSEQFEALENFLKEYNVEEIGVDSENFNYSTAKKLEENHQILAVENPITVSRETKNRTEIEVLQKVQSITEKSMKEAEKTIRQSETRDGKLWLKDKPLTADRVKKNVEKYLIEEGCRNMEGMIVTSGRDSGEPHRRSSGVLKPEEPIVVDIFPRHRSMYFGDMTRTFVKGKPPDKIKDMHEAVRKAQQTAFQYLKESEKRSGEELHNKVCDRIEAEGYGTLRNDDETGFIHSTGHGVGLDLHEAPRLGLGGNNLEPGMIVTIEPGLYNPEVGGLRIEDMVRITEDGYENFNSMHKRLEIS